MSLSTDLLLFSIVLVLFAIQTALPVTEDGLPGSVSLF